MMVSRMSFLFFVYTTLPGPRYSTFPLSGRQESPNAPHLGTLLDPIPNIPVAPALLVYPHVRDCSFRLSRRLTETGGWFYVLEVTLRGSACGSGPWQHCPVSFALTCQCFAYFSAQHLSARYYGTCVGLRCSPWRVPTPLTLHGLAQLENCVTRVRVPCYE
jgi:hypothetical protein